MEGCQIDVCSTLGTAAELEAERDSLRPHQDDVAVDRFALAMKAKLAEARAKGRSGWNDPQQCSIEFLAQLLVGHLAKGNAGNFEDIANFCMMLHQRRADPQVLLDAQIELCKLRAVADALIAIQVEFAEKAWEPGGMPGNEYYRSKLVNVVSMARAVRGQ